MKIQYWLKRVEVPKLRFNSQTGPLGEETGKFEVRWQVWYREENGEEDCLDQWTLRRDAKEILAKLRGNSK